MESRGAKLLIRAGAGVAMAFLYVPLVIVVLYSFNNSVGQRWPITSYTTKYFGLAWRNPDLRTALWNSVQIALAATGIALVLGSLAAFAVHRFRFFGRNSVSFLLILPVALPGIITAIALSSTVTAFGASFGLLATMVGHATFCMVVVYNNVLARLRRTPGSLVEASMDLGADGWTTFRLVTFPAVRAALVAGALLSFALSFDEIIVTNFLIGTDLTVPKFIFNNIRQPRNRPIVNVVAVAAMLVTLIPVILAQRLAGGATSSSGAGSKDQRATV